MFVQVGKKLKGKHLYSFLSLLGLLSVIPVFESQNIIIVLVLSLVMLFSLYISTNRKNIFRGGLIISLFCILDTAFFDMIIPSPIFGILSWIIFLAYTFVVLMNNLFTYKVVSSHDIFGGLVGYLIMALIWSFIFTIIEYLEPNSFHFPPNMIINIQRFLYFSFVTMTTLGYGEIYPVGKYAQVACIILTVFGQFYALTIISLIVGKYISKALEKQKE